MERKEEPTAAEKRDGDGADGRGGGTAEPFIDKVEGAGGLQPDTRAISVCLFTD